MGCFMGKYSKIEWTDATWSPVTGCTPVSDGCHNCYARRMAYRLRGRFGYPEDDPFRVTLHEGRIKEPLGWRKPRRVFVCSMGDLFHPDVPFEFIAAVFRVMTKCTQHTFMILTKRPNQVKAFYLLSSGSAPWAQKVCENIWVGVTAENQQAADERIPILLQIPAAVRFVSVEPMLGPVNLEQPTPNAKSVNGVYPPWMIQQLDWIIVGGESGPNARPMHPDWVRSLRDQCQAAGVPFFFKSWGEWKPVYTTGPEFELSRLKNDEIVMSGTGHGVVMKKVGKKKSGHLLDGREWNEVPEVAKG